MTVALTAHYLGPQLGIGQYLDRLVPFLVEELTGRGIDVRVLGSPNAVANTPSLRRLGDTLKVLPQLDYPPLRRYAWVFTMFGTYCRKNDISTVAWLSNPLVVPWHPPTLSVLHDVNEWKNDDKGWLRTRLRSAIYLDSSLRFATTVVAVSKSTERDIRRFRPGISGKGRLKTVSNGVDSGLRLLPSVEVPAPQAPFLLSVGRIDPRGKRLREAVSFVEALRERSGDGWELHLVGGMNKSTAESGMTFLSSIEELTWVHYHGYVDNSELAEWYRRTSAVVFLSEDEGFGLPIAEAVSFGCPAVISDQNDAGREAGGDGVIAVDLQDLEGGAERFLRMLNDGPCDVSMAQLPTWKSAASKYADLLVAMERH